MASNRRRARDLGRHSQTNWQSLMGSERRSLQKADKYVALRRSPRTSFFSANTSRALQQPPSSPIAIERRLARFRVLRAELHHVDRRGPRSSFGMAQPTVAVAGVRDSPAYEASFGRFAYCLVQSVSGEEDSQIRLRHGYRRGARRSQNLTVCLIDQAAASLHRTRLRRCRSAVGRALRHYGNFPMIWNMRQCHGTDVADFVR